MSQITAAPGLKLVGATTSATTAATAAGATSSATSAAAAPASSEHDEIREYEKIIQFRDTVVSGKHPRIKVPASSVVKNTVAIQPPPSSAPERVLPSSTPLPIINNVANGRSMGNLVSSQANAQHPAVTNPPASSTPFIPGVSRLAFGPSKPEIDPILLKKSDGLVKAETQIQRQRVEKLLKDQVEQQKRSIKGSQSVDQLADLDISDILAKALTLVQATAPPAVSNLPSPTANASDASDSFDENTFYSSQHDTPESQHSVPVSNPLGSVQVQHAPIPPSQTQGRAPPPEPLTTYPLPSSALYLTQPNNVHNVPANGPIITRQNANHPAKPVTPIQTRAVTGAPKAVPHNVSNHNIQNKHLDLQATSSESRDASRSDNCGNTDSEQSADQHGLQNPPRPVPNPRFRDQGGPVIRAHDLLPFAPQPAHVSSLATSRQSHIQESDTRTPQRQPPQLTALRQEVAVVISPESSPQGDKGDKKKNKKKNKRKSGARAQDVQGSPIIKPEPGSPSPVNAPPFIRPQKRPRRYGRQEPEIIYDEPILERPASQVHQVRYPPAPIHTVGHPHEYEALDDPYSRQVRHSVAPAARGLESPLYEERRPDGTIIRYVRHVPSPSRFPDPYAAVESRPIRTSSYTVGGPDLREVSAYPRDGRMSVRPYSDRARSRSPILVERRPSVMPPPSAPPRRIVIDEYGHEYFEPIRTATAPRHSIVPPTRPGEHEFLYDRTPIRATSRIPAPEIVGEDGMIYRRASPGYVPRRIVTQPEYATEFRSYRERDYPLQPMAPPSQEFVQIRPAADHLPREYLPRSASARPVESVPYDRLPSSRPDMPPRQYTASVHPDTRREIGRDYSVRPTEMELQQPTYGIRPVERYYEQPSREGDVTYIERPRAVHEDVVYPSNGHPRQVYQ